MSVDDDRELAAACARGDADAIARFEALVRDDVIAAARAIDRDPAFVDEIVQRTRVHLLVGDPPRIAGYRATGPLRAWAAIAARRLALNAKRDAGPRAADDDVLADLIDREPDPEVRHLRTLYRAELRAALADALAALDDRARAVLRLRFVDGLELAQLGRIYGVHESTVSRWVSGALAGVAAATKAGLIARLEVTSATADSVARLAESGLDLSIARLLEASPNR